jgi:hypothetical protein
MQSFGAHVMTTSFGTCTTVLMSDGLIRTFFSNHQILATRSLRAESQLLFPPIQKRNHFNPAVLLGCVDGSSAGLETPCRLWHQKIHYPIHDSPQYELSHLKSFLQNPVCSLHIFRANIALICHLYPYLPPPQPPRPPHSPSFKHFSNIIVQRIDVYFITLSIIIKQQTHCWEHKNPSAVT